MTKQQVVLVTGARKGIGRHLAEHFLAQGAVVEGCSRGEADWDAESFHYQQVDVADERQVIDLLSSIRKRHGRLDVLINSAGVAVMNHALLTPGDTVSRILDTNVRGTFLVSREAAKVMRRGRFGRIVNLGSVAGPMGIEGEAVYAASKDAIVSLTRSLAGEFAQFGITCNVVAPTPIETDLIRGVPKEKIQAIVDRLAIRRLGRFEDVSNVVDFFVKPESDYITGQVVYLGGV